MRRRTQVLWFYATTLRSSRASLRDFHAHASAAYATCGFERALAPREWEQLALHASFPPAAAAALARCLREAAADGEEASGAGLATAAAAADNDDGSQHGGPAAERPADRAAPRRRPLQQQLQLQRLSQVTVPAWRMKYFLFWFNRWAGRGGERACQGSGRPPRRGGPAAVPPPAQRLSINGLSRPLPRRLLLASPPARNLPAPPAATWRRFSCCAPSGSSRARSWCAALT